MMKLNLAFFITLLLAIAGAVCQSIHATVLTTSMTVDNEFDIYISTNDNIQGTFFGSNNNWPTVTTHNTSLTPNVVNYIHVVGRDAGGIEMFLGQFTLSDTNFQFSNGTQTLLTNATNWQVSNTGFGSGYVTPHDYGLNGVGPWGFFSSNLSCDL
jgi:MSHA biogenesis protein MshQ